MIVTKEGIKRACENITGAHYDPEKAKEIELISKQYESNFQILQKSFQKICRTSLDTWVNALKKEDELYRRGKQLRKEMGIVGYDPSDIKKSEKMRKKYSILLRHKKPKD